MFVYSVESKATYFKDPPYVILNSVIFMIVNVSHGKTTVHARIKRIPSIVIVNMDRLVLKVE